LIAAGHPDAVADGRDRVEVLAEVAADLQLQLGVAGVHERGRLVGVRLGLVDEEVADDGHRCAAHAAEQFGHRHAQRLALDVQQRHLDAGDRVGGDRGPVAGVFLHAVQQPLEAQRVLADEELLELAFDDRLDDRERRPGRLPDADDALVGLDLEDQTRRGLADATGPLQRLPERHPDRSRLDTCDPQERVYARARSMDCQLSGDCQQCL
jgi:hypothetical protein